MFRITHKIYSSLPIKSDFLLPNTWKPTVCWLSTKLNNEEAIKNKTSENESTKKVAKFSVEEYKPIFMFPGIKWVHALSRLKLYPPIITIGGIPTCLVLESTQVIESGSWLALLILGSLQTMVLFAVGVLLDRTIGKIYANEDGSKIIISYVNYWGRRENICLPVSNVEGIKEFESKIQPYLFSKVKLLNPESTYKINLKNGVIMKRETFLSVFGAFDY